MTPLTEAFIKVVDATTTDWTGHLPNCGYTNENQNCACAAWAGRLSTALSEIIDAAEARGRMIAELTKEGS